MTDEKLAEEVMGICIAIAKAWSDNPPPPWVRVGNNPPIPIKNILVREHIAAALSARDAEIAQKDAEIERLTAELDRMRKRWQASVEMGAEADKQAAAKDEEIERLRNAEHQLSAAYIRLRELIPGAFDTPHGPSPEEVWAHTESKLAELARLRAQPAADDKPTIAPLSLTKDQEEYLRDLRQRETNYDPTTVIGGPRQAKPTADDVERARDGHGDACWYCKEKCSSLAGNPGLWPLLLPLDPERPGYCVAVHNRCVLDRVKRADDVAATGRQDARRQALEEAAQIVVAEFKRTNSAHNDKHYLASILKQRALADNPATTDVISLVRDFRRAVESTSVGDPLKMPEWRALCAAMNEIDK